MHNTVKLVKCKEYDFKKVSKIITQSINFYFPQSIEKKIVLLKPNILSDSDVTKRVTTDPVVVDATIKAFKNRGAIVWVGDSPAMHTKKFNGSNCGIQEVCQKNDVRWINFTDESFTKNGFKLTTALQKCDILVSLSKLKTHELTYFTGSVKNLYGLIPGFTKSKLHLKYPDRDSFSNMLLDLHDTVKPDFTIMDGIIGMQGAGPQNGTPKECGFLISSTNLAAVDMCACELIGYNPMDIPLIKFAVERNMIPNSVQELTFVDENPTDNKIKSFKKIVLEHKNSNILLKFISFGFMKKIIKRYSKQPIFIQDKCIKCGKCIKMCPADSISFSQKKGKAIDFDNTNCIKCFCCAEVCPESAIKIGRKL